MSTSSRSRKSAARRQAVNPPRRRGVGSLRKPVQSGKAGAPRPRRGHAGRSSPRAAAAPSPRTSRAALPRYTTLRLGSRGDAVGRLQQRLTDRGFPCGAIDGEFGRGTEAALIAFQLSEGLLADGVAGPRTLTALGLMTDDSLPSSTGELTVQVAAAMCPGAPLGNIKAHLPALLQAMNELQLVDRTMLLMAVATICVETGRFAPLDEYRSRYNTSPNAEPPYFDLYDNRRDLGNRGPHDGAAYKGRGFVQLTGRTNYGQVGRALGLGNLLVREPERANEPLTAARVLARFLKDRELKIKQALLEHDFALARRCVNGGSHGLPEFTQSFLAGERLMA